MQRRIPSMAAACVGLALTLTACSGGGSGTAAPSQSSSSSQASSTPSSPLTVWADATRAPVIAGVAKEFTAKTGVRVKVVERDYGKMRDDFISQAPTGNGPDLLIGGGDWTGKLVQNGVVAPVQLGDAASTFSPVAIQGVTYDGQVYGLPYALENVAMFRNPALAPTAPTTMAQALKAGGAAVRAGKAKYPFLIQTDPTAGDPYHLYPLQTSFGAPVFATSSNGDYDPKDLAMSGPEGQRFAVFLKQLGKDGVVSPTVTPDIAKEAFLKGQTPFIVSGPWNGADFRKAIPNVAIEPIPSAGGKPAAPFVGTQAFFISSKSKQQVAANQFVVNYLGTASAQLALFKAGGRPPALLAAAQDPQVTSDVVMKQFAAVAQGGVPLPNIPAMDAVWSDWGTTEVAIMSGKGDPKKLWAAACASIEKKIAAAQ